MTMTMYQTAAYIHPNHAVEVPVTIDGRAARAAIEWSTIERLMATSPIDEEQVREFLHRSRNDIARALRAHIYAQGIPLSRHVVLEAEDFDAIHSTPDSGLETDADDEGVSQTH
jgi:hypothetical protein